MTDIKKMGEDEIIDLFNPGKFSYPVIKGIGDDCAVIGKLTDNLCILSTDMLIEDVHFSQKTISPEDLGRKSLNVNLSDIAAMGGIPIAALLSLSLPRGIKESWLRRFSESFLATSATHSCQIIGGDTCGSVEKIAISVTVIGNVPEDEILMRTGASENDDIWISGTPGLSAIGLQVLVDKGDYRNGNAAEAVDKHLHPVPRIELARKIATRKLANAAMDTSDGLVRDLTRLCNTNNLGAILEEELIPLPTPPEKYAPKALEFALHGGEDYELMFTSPRENRELLREIEGLTLIGCMTSSTPELVLKRTTGESETLSYRGFSHF